MKKFIFPKIIVIFSFIIIFIFSSIHSSYCLKIGSKMKLTNTNKNQLQSSLQTQTNLTTKNCNSLCQECSINDFNYCTRCGMEGLYYNFACYKRCPEGTFLNNRSKSCEKCNDKCPVCWGSEAEMCGTTNGVNSYVVKLQEEIEKFAKNNKFSKLEIENWLITLKTIFDEEKEEFQSDKGSGDTFTTNQVYNTESDKIIELPLGSHSKFDGVFIPVPTYINKKKVLVKSHWIYKKGMWDGKRWVQQYFPRLPSFIRLKGEKNLIYYENGGFWAWDQIKDWYWIKSVNLFEPLSSVQDVINTLNIIKFDVGIYLIFS